MKIEDVESKLKEIQDKALAQAQEFRSEIDSTKKDFELKIQSADKNAKEYKELAEKREEELRQFKEQFEKDKVEKDKLFKEARENDVKEFVHSLKKNERILPAHEPMVIKLMESMTSESMIMSFKEKDGSERKHSQLSLFKLLLSSLVKGSNFKQFTPTSPQHAETPDNNASTEGLEAETFMDVLTEGTVKRMKVDEADLAAKAYEYQAEQTKRGITVSYEDALIALSPKVVKA